MSRLGTSILLWAMTTFPGLPDDESARFQAARQTVESGNAGEEEKTEQLAAIDNEEGETKLLNSIAGSIGHTMEPVLKPMGFDWKIGTALIGAFATKEVFVAQMGLVSDWRTDTSGIRCDRVRLSSRQSAWGRNSIGDYHAMEGCFRGFFY